MARASCVDLNNLAHYPAWTLRGVQVSMTPGAAGAGPAYRVREIIAFCYLCRESMEINPGQILSIALASVPTMLTVLVGILINNSRLGDVNSRIDDLRSQMDSRIGDLRSHMDSRFDEMRSTWTSELRRVEEVLDARLKHLEER